MTARAGFPFAALSRPPSAVQIAGVKSFVRALLEWQRTMRIWPKLDVSVPIAMPFVSLYANSRLRGCMGSDESEHHAQNLAHAFLLAMHDSRGVAPVGAQRDSMVARVSYAIAPRRISLEKAADLIEPGTHGLAWVPHDGRPSILMPFVARDGGLDARGLLASLTRKAKLADGALSEIAGTLFVFESIDIVVSRTVDRVSKLDENALAAAWLAQQIDRDGEVCFAVDANTGVTTMRGEAHHARASVLVAALAAHGGHDRAVVRARRALSSDIVRGLEDASRVTSWPTHPAQVAGLLALAARAEIPAANALKSYANAHASLIAQSSWHAAQVVGVLGAEAPRELWSTCVANLESRPFAPWTAMAAHTLGDSRVLDRSVRALVDSLRDSPPHRGGSNATAVPEIALTAAAIEALVPVRTSEARAAVRRGRAFLRRWQLTPERLAPVMNGEVALGAFPASPVRTVLRCDITGHALLALLG